MFFLFSLHFCFVFSAITLQNGNRNGEYNFEPEAIVQHRFQSPCDFLCKMGIKFKTHVFFYLSDQ